MTKIFNFIFQMYILNLYGAIDYAHTIGMYLSFILLSEL